jgi:hypothetical protein
MARLGKTATSAWLAEFGDDRPDVPHDAIAAAIDSARDELDGGTDIGQ